MFNYKDSLAELLKAYVELNRLQAHWPGNCAHMLASSIHFIERQIVRLLKALNE